MQAGEIVLVVIVILVLVLVSVLLCFRCWKAVCEVIVDDQTPKRETIISSMRDGIRRSFRSSMRRMSGLRNSLRRSGKSKKQTTSLVVTPSPAVATITGLQREASELHPSYLKNTLKNEQASSVPRGDISIADVIINDPTAGMGGSIKPSPNPLYESSQPSARPPPLQRIQAHLGGYNRMEEHPVDVPGRSSVSIPHASVKTDNGCTNSAYEYDSSAMQTQRYDTPFEEDQGQNSTLPKAVIERAVDLGVGLDSVTFTGDGASYI